MEVSLGPHSFSGPVFDPRARFPVAGNGFGHCKVAESLFKTCFLRVGLFGKLRLERVGAVA